VLVGAIHELPQGRKKEERSGAAGAGLAPAQNNFNNPAKHYTDTHTKY